MPDSYGQNHIRSESKSNWRFTKRCLAVQRFNKCSSLNSPLQIRCVTIVIVLKQKISGNVWFKCDNVPKIRRLFTIWNSWCWSTKRMKTHSVLSQSMAAWIFITQMKIMLAKCWTSWAQCCQLRVPNRSGSFHMIFTAIHTIVNSHLPSTLYRFRRTVWCVYRKDWLNSWAVFHKFVWSLALRTLFIWLIHVLHKVSLLCSIYLTILINILRYNIELCILFIDSHLDSCWIECNRLLSAAVRCDLQSEAINRIRSDGYWSDSIQRSDFLSRPG